MSSSTVYLDTETTGLDPFHDQIWELYAHRINPDGTHKILSMQIVHDLHLTWPLPPKFREDHDRRYNAASARTPYQATQQIIEFFGQDKPHLVGLNPAFDATMITHLIHPYMPTGGLWNYHLQDVEAMTIGYLAARGEHVELPFKSDALARRVGINPDDFDRHTAAGDVAFTMAWYTAITEDAADNTLADQADPTPHISAAALHKELDI